MDVFEVLKGPEIYAVIAAGAAAVKGIAELLEKFGRKVPVLDKIGRVLNWIAPGNKQRK